MIRQILVEILLSLAIIYTAVYTFNACTYSDDDVEEINQKLEECYAGVTVLRVENNSLRSIKPSPKCGAIPCESIFYNYVPLEIR